MRLFQVVDQVDKCEVLEQIGEPVQVPIFKYRDTKARVMEMIGAFHPSQILGSNEEDDDSDLYDSLNSQDDHDAQIFNNAMASSPYATDDKGVANYERELAKNDEELAELRKFMALKDNPTFQHLASFFDGQESPDQLAMKIRSFMKDFAASPEPPVDGNKGEGEAE